MSDYTPVSPDLTAEELRRAVECLAGIGTALTIADLILPQPTDQLELTEQDKQWLNELKIAL